MADVDRRGLPLLAQLVPENAPFDEEQRAWLNGFLAGLLGLASGADSVRSELEVPRGSPAPPVWRDPALPLERRMALAAGEELEQRLCAALAQLDCGQCGSSCQGYARALAIDAERDTSRCVPGGRSTERALDALLSERGQASGARAALIGRVAQRALGGDSPGAPLPAERAVRRQEPSGDLVRLRIRSQRKLTLADAGTEIREVVLESSEGALSYRTGDSLAVFPQNDPDLVRGLLRALGARGQETVNTRSGPREAWRCLLEDCDVTHIRPETLELFAREARERGEGYALREMMERGVPPGFDLLDLLGACPKARPPIDRVIATLAGLEPRVYWIASSQRVHPAEVHLAVRLVRAERGGRERKGVASHFLGEATFGGEAILARVQSDARFALPEACESPLILLAAGTGVARYRAYLEELAARGRRGDTWLILASCQEGDDALYDSELGAWSRQGVIEHLDISKLGQRGRRGGLGDILRKRARRVLSWLDRGALIYVCGEGRGLGAGVADALAEIVGKGAKYGATAAELVQALGRDGRWIEESY